MYTQALEEELDTIKLSCGDVIIESETGNVGFLVKCTRRVDIQHDDMYFWEIRWADKAGAQDFKAFPHFNLFEEDYLKIAIILGIIKWQSVNGETNEL
jgi:hypothetical protein